MAKWFRYTDQIINMEHVFRIRKNKDTSLKIEFSTGSMDIDFDNIQDRDENFEQLSTYLLKL